MFIYPAFQKVEIQALLHQALINQLMEIQLVWTPTLLSIAQVAALYGEPIMGITDILNLVD